MACYLGIDVGDKRVGLALLDQSVGIAFPQKPIARSEAIQKLQAIASDKAIVGIIVGLPLTAEHKITPQAQKVTKFVAQLLKSGVLAKIVYVDEHLSTEDAAERLREAGKSVAEARKSGALDCLVAALLLEGYIQGQIPEIAAPAQKQAE